MRRAHTDFFRGFNHCKSYPRQLRFNRELLTHAWFYAFGPLKSSLPIVRFSQKRKTHHLNIAVVNVLTAPTSTITMSSTVRAFERHRKVAFGQRLQQRKIARRNGYLRRCSKQTHRPTTQIAAAGCTIHCYFFAFDP